MESWFDFNFIWLKGWHFVAELYAPSQQVQRHVIPKYLFFSLHFTVRWFQLLSDFDYLHLSADLSLPVISVVTNNCNLPFSLVCIPLMSLVRENYTRLKLDKEALTGIENSSWSIDYHSIVIQSWQGKSSSSKSQLRDCYILDAHERSFIKSISGQKSQLYWIFVIRLSVCYLGMSFVKALSGNGKTPELVVKKTQVSRTGSVADQRDER